MPHDNDKNSKPARPTALPARPMRLPGITPPNAPKATQKADTIPSNHIRTDNVTDPQIVCPECRTEIKLAESLAAPLIAETRRQFEAQLAAREADSGRREARLKQIQDDVTKARESVDEQVTARLRAERAAIVEAEAKKAKSALADELGRRDRELDELQQSLATNNAKLAEAQQAQTEMLRKQRELNDARREVDLTVEKKVQEHLAAVRENGQAGSRGHPQVQGRGEGGPDRRHAARDRGSSPPGRAGFAAAPGRNT
jgi:DNA repair exonuclease SbcCD ATPase subunit